MNEKEKRNTIKLLCIFGAVVLIAEYIRRGHQTEPMPAYLWFAIIIVLLVAGSLIPLKENEFSK